MHPDSHAPLCKAVVVEGFAVRLGDGSGKATGKEFSFSSLHSSSLPINQAALLFFSQPLFSSSPSL